MPSLVARRGIYKDVYGTPAENGRERADYQLRSNFPVAMTVAPELFEPVRALAALKIFQEGVVGPLGVKTLDPLDPDYRGTSRACTGLALIPARLLRQLERLA